MKPLLEYWNENLHGKIEGNCIRFDNEAGKGYADTFQLNESFQLFRVDILLTRELSGKPYIFKNEDDYLSIIFGDASSIIFDGNINLSLDGVLFSNSKNNIQWTLKPNKKINLIILRVRYDYFYQLVNRSSSLQSFINKEEEYAVFEEMSLLMKGTFYRIFELHKTPYLQELLFSCSSYLFHLLIDQLSQREKIREKGSGPLNFKSLIIARSMILDTQGHPIDIDVLAKECGMSSSGLRINFKKTFGIPIYQLQQKVRLEKAKELLIEQQKSISMISTDLGFSNVSHFASVFKKEYKMTPKQYQLKERDK